MLKIKNKQTFRKKTRMEQKNKFKSATKTIKLHKDLRQGIISIYIKKSMVVSERSIANIHMGLKRYLKKIGVVFLRPVQIKTTTAKGEKRLGKGKGAVVTYNRAVPLKAGLLLFELGFVTQLSSSKIINLAKAVNSLLTKLPMSVTIKTYNKAYPKVTRHTPVLFTPFK